MYFMKNLRINSKTYHRHNNSLIVNSSVLIRKKGHLLKIKCSDIDLLFLSGFQIAYDAIKYRIWSNLSQKVIIGYASIPINLNFSI